MAVQPHANDGAADNEAALLRPESLDAMLAGHGSGLHRSRGTCWLRSGFLLVARRARWSANSKRTRRRPCPAATAILNWSRSVTQPSLHRY